jgi:hypothetical protein
MSLHSTSATTERNWSLRGRAYTASRTRLGIERAKKLITFCFDDRAHGIYQDDFNLLLSVMEGEGEIGDDCENMIGDCEDI